MEDTGLYRVLAVDDEDANLRTMARTFRRRFAMTTATSGQEALEILARESFDLLLADYSMPGMNGIQLLDRARDLQPKMVRVIVTGYADARVLEQALASGLCAAVVAKPWTRESVEAAVRPLLARRDLP